MVSIFTTVSKYICILLILMFSYCHFRVLILSGRREPWDQNDADSLLDSQYRILLLFHFLCSAVIFLSKQEIPYLLFYLFQLSFFLLYVPVMRLSYKNVNRLLLNTECLFLCFGLIMLTRLSLEQAVKQYVIIVISMLSTLIIPFLLDKLWYFEHFWTIFAGLGLFLLSGVYILGRVSYGAKISISIMGFSFQASEFVKISFVFCAAGLLSGMRGSKRFIVPTIVAGLHVLVLVLCRDLGSALIFSMAFLFMLYLANGRGIVLLTGTAFMGAGAALSYRLFSHVRTRVFAWLDPWSDLDDKGYQIGQSLFAIGTGGFAGLGLGQGLPGKIPIVEKDFIFSAISEELGGIIAICLILLCMGCFIQMMLIALYMRSGFYRYLAVGLSIEYAVQVILTIGGAIKFIPSTGVTLPFVSYGGSSIAASFIMFAIIQALYIVRGNEEELPDSAIPDTPDTSVSAPLPTASVSVPPDMLSPDPMSPEFYNEDHNDNDNKAYYDNYNKAFYNNHNKAYYDNYNRFYDNGNIDNNKQNAYIIEDNDIEDLD